MRLKNYGLYFTMLFSTLSFAGEMSSSELFKMTINGGKTEFAGRATSVFDLTMLNISTKMTFKEKLGGMDKYKVIIATNGNNWVIRRSSILFPTKGDVQFAIKDDRQKLIKYFYEGEEVTFDNENKTLYIVESEKEYRNRLARISLVNKEMGSDYLITGPFIAIVRFDIYGPLSADFYEIKEGNNLVDSGVFRRIYERNRL